MKNLKRCRKATIYDDEKNLLCHASVFLDEDTNIRISVSKEFDATIQENFEIIFFDPVMGLIPCRCTLSDKDSLSKDTVSFLCNIVERGEQIQRRMDIKVPVDIDIVMRTDEIVGGILDIVDGGYSAKLMDISAGGTYLVSKMCVNQGAIIEFQLTETKTPIHLSAKVLRSMRQVDEAGNVTYGHGCQFVELSRSDEMQLRAFVYQVERELYSNDIW